MVVDRSQVKNILVIKLRAVGDVLLSTIVTKNLRLAFPSSRIEYLTEPPSVSFLETNPYIDGVMAYDRSTTSGLGLIQQVRRKGFDLVIDLFGNPRTALVTRLSRARYRVGFRFRGRSYAYNIRVSPRGGEVHNTQFNLDAIEAIGVDIQDRNTYFHVTPKDDEAADFFLRGAELGGRFIAGINTGGGWYTKRWGLDRFARLADLLVEQRGASVILLWGPGQKPDVESIQSMMKHKAFIPPETTLLQLGALLKRCSILVSNDSGPMHIAAAVGTPVLGIYGPTNPILQGPYGTNHVVVRNEKLECLGCNFTSCPIGHPCMKELTVDDVLNGVKLLLKTNAIVT